MSRKDYVVYDYLIGMDSMNLRNMLRILKEDPKHKCCRLLDFTDHLQDIADPWYTGDFERTYQQIDQGCRALLEKIRKER